MRNIKKRIDKIEAKNELMKAESDERKAKLLKLKQLEKDDSIEAMFLRAELESGHKLSLVDIIALVQSRGNMDGE